MSDTGSAWRVRGAMSALVGAGTFVAVVLPLHFLQPDVGWRLARQ